VARIDAVAGQIYNIGGGPEYQMAIWTEFSPRLEALIGHEITVARSDWRPGDQRIFVADIRKAARELDWRPTVDVDTGIERLYKWVAGHLDLVRRTA
jgi:CDP-paratose 2-epimerase